MVYEPLHPVMRRHAHTHTHTHTENQSLKNEVIGEDDLNFGKDGDKMNINVVSVTVKQEMKRLL